MVEHCPYKANAVVRFHQGLPAQGEKMLTEEQLIGWSTAHHIQRLYERKSEQSVEACALHLALLSVDECPDILKILSEILDRAQEIINNKQSPEAA